MAKAVTKSQSYNVELCRIHLDIPITIGENIVEMELGAVQGELTKKAVGLERTLTHAMSTLSQAKGRKASTISLGHLE